MTVSKKVELLLREKRGKEIKRNPVADVVRSTAVDVVDLYEREVFVPSFGGRISPVTVSPDFKALFFIWLWLT